MTDPDPNAFTLAEWTQLRGTRTGTQTLNGHTYTDMNEVEWRQATGRWGEEEGSTRT